MSALPDMRSFNHTAVSAQRFCPDRSAFESDRFLVLAEQICGSRSGRRNGIGRVATAQHIRSTPKRFQNHAYRRRRVKGIEGRTGFQIAGHVAAHRERPFVADSTTW